MIMVDSSVWIDYFNGVSTKQSEQLDELLGVKIIATGDLILAEVLQGFRSDKDYLRAREFFSALSFYQIGGWDQAIKSGENYRFLRKKGITVRKTIDIFIGTFCIENKIPLLHSDHDFDVMEEYLGLEVLK